MVLILLIFGAGHVLGAGGNRVCVGCGDAVEVVVVEVVVMVFCCWCWCGFWFLCWC